MRITHIFSRFKTYSGAEHFCFRFAREAVERGDRVTIITRHLPPALRDHLPEDVEVRQLSWAHKPTRFHFFESICDVLYSPLLFTLVPRDSECDVYWNDNTLASLFIDSLRREKHRIFFCMQLPHFAYGQTLLVTRSYPPLSWLVPLLVPVYRWLDRRFARRADLIVAISEMVRKDCARVYGRDDVRVAGPGVDLPGPEVIDPDFVRSRLPTSVEHVLVSVGKIVPKKNFDLFVRTVDLLRRSRIDVAGVIVGDGPLRARIADLIERLGLEEHCVMVGFVPEYRDVLRYMSGASVYVYLEKNVPFGLTPLEAGSLGVPVVAYRGGGVEETIVDGENGYKLSHNSGPEQIAAVVRDLLSRPPAERAKMGACGRRMAEHWTWTRAYDRFRRIIGGADGGAAGTGSPEPDPDPSRAP